MPLLPGVFSIYTLDPKFIWLPRPKWLKQEMAQHIPGIGGVNPVLQIIHPYSVNPIHSINCKRLNITIGI